MAQIDTVAVHVLRQREPLPVPWVSVTVEIFSL